MQTNCICLAVWPVARIATVAAHAALGHDGCDDASRTQREGVMNRKPTRGFAVMAPERQRELASSAGALPRTSATAHEFTSDEAREAGRKNGVAVGRIASTWPRSVAQVPSDAGRRNTSGTPGRCVSSTPAP